MPPDRIALPIPRVGTALSEDGDAYVASLDVVLRAPGGTVALDGTTFESLTMAVGLRHLAFHPRSRAAIPGAIPATAMARHIEANWSSVDSHGVEGAAERVLAICADGGEVGWRIGNEHVPLGEPIEQDDAPVPGPR